jgi:NADPH-dependent 2,4-dienoyl-CoA reductase/sulfur reductase-like enzyme
VVGAVDVLAGRAGLTGRVVVIGGGMVGLEAAEHLAARDGVTSVTVVEQLDSVGRDLGLLRRISVLEALGAAGVVTLAGARCAEVTDGAVVVERDGGRESVAYDWVATAVGARPRDHVDIERWARDRHVPSHVVGDAAQACRALEAIREAAEVARAI